jgi:hypothetical protein
VRAAGGRQAHRRWIGEREFVRSGELRASARVLLYFSVSRFGQKCAAPGENFFFGAASGLARGRRPIAVEAGGRAPHGS